MLSLHWLYSKYAALFKQSLGIFPGTQYSLLYRHGKNPIEYQAVDDVISKNYSTKSRWRTGFQVHSQRSALVILMYR